MTRRFALLDPDYWRGEGEAEGAMLRSVFFVLVTASVAMLALDLSSMMQRAGDPAIDMERTGPVEMEPPKDADQERPYFPKAAPVAPGTRPPEMPGLVDRPSPTQLASRMTFTVDGAGNLAAVGRIEPGTAADFDRMLQDKPGTIKKVYLHSPGGSVSDAIAMARAIRKAGIATIVPENAYCASSCPLLFAGGVEREAGRKVWIGVHQVFTLPSETGTLHEGLANAQRISAECQEHLVAMGVDPRAWILAMKTAKHRLYVFTQKELTDLKLVTKSDVSPAPPAKASASKNG